MYYFFFFDVDPLKHFFYFLCLAALGLGCCVHALSSCRRWGLLFTLMLRLLIVVAPLAVEHGFRVQRLRWLWVAGSAVMAYAFSCLATHEIFLNQVSIPCPLPWEEDS